MPEEGKLPEPEKLQSWFDQETSLKTTVAANIATISGGTGNLLQAVSVELIKNLRDELLGFVAALGSTQNRTFSWIPKAVQDVVADNDRPWRVHLKHCQEQLDQIRGLSRQIQNVSVSMPGDMDLHWLREGAQILQQHFAAGGGMGFWPFIPKVVNEYRELIDKVRINGRQCTNTETLGKLTEHLTVALALDSVWTFWAAHLNKTNTPFLLQVAYLDEQNEALEEVIAL